MENKKYEEFEMPEVKVILFENEDIVTTSPDGAEGELDTSDIE